jgi:hypothetical protein
LGVALSWTTSTAKHLIIIINFLLIAAFISRFYFDKVLSDLNESVKIKSEILKQNSKFESTYKDLQKKIAAINTISQSGVILSRLEEVTGLIPNGIKFNSMNYLGQTLTFRASAPNRELLDQLINNLQSLSYVKSLSIPSIERRTGNNPGIDANFILKLI